MADVPGFYRAPANKPPPKQRSAVDTPRAPIGGRCHPPRCTGTGHAVLAATRPLSQRAEKLAPICPSERCEKMLAAGAKPNIHNGRHKLHDAAHAAERCRVVNGRGADACVLQSSGHFDEAPVRRPKRMPHSQPRRNSGWAARMSVAVTADVNPPLFAGEVADWYWGVDLRCSGRAPRQRWLRDRHRGPTTNKGSGRVDHFMVFQRRLHLFKLELSLAPDFDRARLASRRREVLCRYKPVRRWVLVRAPQWPSVR